MKRAVKDYRRHAGGPGGVARTRVDTWGCASPEFRRKESVGTLGD